MTLSMTDTTGDGMARKKRSGRGASKSQRMPYHAGPPSGFHAGAPADAIKSEFGRVLQAKLVEKNWNQSDLAREAAKHMPSKEFQRDNVSQYVRGLSLPGTVRLNAMAKALGCKPADLLPVRATENIDSKAPPLDARWLGDGNVWLRVNQAVPESIALSVLGLLRGDNGPDKR